MCMVGIWYIMVYAVYAQQFTKYKDIPHRISYTHLYSIVVLYIIHRAHAQDG